MTSQLIGSALDRVVHSKTFARSRSLQDFLTFIVTQSLEPDQNLKEYRIGVDALKRGGAFDPAENSIVRVQAYRLRAKLNDYYQHEGQTEDLRIDLEPGSYTPVIRECALVTTQRSLRFPGLILDLLPFEHSADSPAAAFVFTVLSGQLEQLLRAAVRYAATPRNSRIHLQVEFRARATASELRAITYLSDADSCRVECSHAVTVGVQDTALGLDQVLEKAGSSAAQMIGARINALLSCNG